MMDFQPLWYCLGHQCWHNMLPLRQFMQIDNDNRSPKNMKKTPTDFALCMCLSVRPNRSGSGSGSAELRGSVRFGRTTELHVFTSRTRTEPKTAQKTRFCLFSDANPEFLTHRKGVWKKITKNASRK